MKIGVVGIGNVVFSDEGVGVHLVLSLKRSYTFSHEKHSIEFIDGGTLAMALTPILTSFDYLIVIDCIEADDALPGDVFFFDFNNIPKNLRWDGSAHEVEMLQTLTLISLAGDLPPTMILGIVPRRIEPMSFELSPDVLKGASIAKDTLLAHLSSMHGFAIEKIASIDVASIAKEFEARGHSETASIL